MKYALTKLELPTSIEFAINYYIDSRRSEGKRPIKVISLISTELFSELIENTFILN